MVIHNESMKSGIVAKLDWFTCMFEDTSFSDVLLFLKLDPELYISDFLRDVHRSRLVFEEHISFCFEGVSLETSVYDVLKENEDDVFYSKFSNVRLDICGSGLDFLRSTGLDVDNYFRDRKNYEGFVYHTTRADFAFDLINYKSEFVDELIKYCQTNCTAAGRVCVLHKPNAYKCSVRTNSEKTVYIGSPSSLRLLRVYDKRLQFIDPLTGIYKKDNDYGNPESWIRIELQTRKHGSDILFAANHGNEENGFWLSLFRHIYDEYTFSNTADTTKQNRRAAEFWSELFDWDQIRTIIQNENFKKKFVSYDTRVRNDFIHNIGRFVRWLAVVYSDARKAGVDEHVYLQQIISRYMAELQHDPRYHSRRCVFIGCLNALNSLNAIEIFDDSENVGLYRDLGYINFKL